MNKPKVGDTIRCEFVVSEIKSSSARPGNQYITGPGGLGMVYSDQIIEVIPKPWTPEAGQACSATIAGTPYQAVIFEVLDDRVFYRYKSSRDSHWTAAMLGFELFKQTYKLK